LEFPLKRPRDPGKVTGIPRQQTFQPSEWIERRCIYRKRFTATLVSDATMEQLADAANSEGACSAPW
jgi:hypothetical protein